MALTKYFLGDLLDLITETNSENKYNVDDVRGMTITKEIIPTKADVSNTDLSKFFVVHPGEFVFNPRTHGKRIGFGYNDTESSFIISWNNIAFKIKDDMKDTVLSEYLFLHFNRSEWDREACYRSWGSSTEVFAWEALCEMELNLPPISVQQKYVDIYNAMLVNQKSYERGLEDLKLVCDGYIEDLRRNNPCEKIGPYINKVDQRNIKKLLGVSYVKSVNMDGTFSKTVANIDPERIHTYKIVEPNDFAYTNRINIGSIAMRLPGDGSCLVSASYDVFRIINRDKIIPEYLALWLRRSEFFRSTGFYSVGSVKDNFSVDMMKLVEIPIPDICIQRAIVEIYQGYLTRKIINEKLKSQIKDICPILIRGSLEEGKTK